MTFVSTGLLIAGALAMAVPILIHLLSRRRRRPIEWAAMRFLIEALRKHRRRLQLEQLLLLAVRCLILLLVGAALARPFLESAGLLDVGGSRTVFLVIDNGLASAARGGDDQGERLTALARSVDGAVDLIDSLGAGDAVGVITAARPATGLIVPPSTDHRAVIQVLRELQPSEAPTDLGAAFPVLRAALDDLGPDRDRAIVYLLSDFRAGSARLETPLPAASTATGPTLLAAPAAQDLVPNVQVTSIEPLRGLVLGSGDEGADQITVTLARSGGRLERDVTRVRLVGEGLPPTEPKVVDWEPGQLSARADFVVNLAGHGDGGIALSAVIDDDALPADNVRHNVLVGRSRVRALLIDRRSFGDPDLDRLGGGQWIERALQPSERSPMDVVSVDPAALDAVDLRGVDAAVVARPDLLTERGWSVLGDFVTTGGVLLVMPPGDSTVHRWTDRLRTSLNLPWRVMLEVADDDEGIPLAPEQPASELLRLLSGDIADLVRPVRVQRILPVDEAQTQAQTVLALADGTPLVIAGSPGSASAPQDESAAGEGRGLVIYVATSLDLDWTNLPAQPLMVPLVHELIKQGIGIVRTSQRYSVGERPGLGLGVGASAMLDPSGDMIAIEGTGRPARPLGRAGLYAIIDPARQPIGAIAVNVDPSAGRTDPQNQAAVSEWLSKSGAWAIFEGDDPAAALRTVGTSASLAGLLLMSVLALVVIETALARWFSHARAGGGDRIRLEAVGAKGALAARGGAL